MTSTSDLLRDGQHFPVGAALGPDAGRTATAGTVRPFGLRWAKVPTAAAQVDLDWSQIAYDPDRQIALVNDEDGSVLPAMRHTSTKTTTSEHDRNPPDSDTDATGT